MNPKIAEPRMGERVETSAGCFETWSDEVPDWLPRGALKFRSQTIEIPASNIIHRTRNAAYYLENGMIVSIAWGDCTYSDNYDASLHKGPFTEEPARVEIAVLDAVGGHEFVAVDHVDDDGYEWDYMVSSQIPVERLRAIIAAVGVLERGAPRVSDELRTLLS